MGKNYRLRTARNEASRETAGRYQDTWTLDDVAFLRENFNDMDRVELAQKLGRTVEACRQKYYAGVTEGIEPARTPIRQTPGQRAWAQGVTSFGEDYW